MCGIFGYVGKRSDSAKIVLEGLKRLEYRGYDSWGIAVLISNIQNPISKKEKKEESQIVVKKDIGAIGDIEADSKFFQTNSNIAIGHTRWATHGGVVLKNAHPHFSSSGDFAVAQNGIVENFEVLKNLLKKKGYKFSTETDTEVIVRLIESKMRGVKGTRSTTGEKEFREAVRLAFGDLEGRNTIIVLSHDGQVIACRDGSPLVVGTNKEKEIFFSSDTLSFADLATRMIVVKNGQMVACRGIKGTRSTKSTIGESTLIELYEIKNDKNLKLNWEKVNVKSDKGGKNGFEHFMIKEIYEIPDVIENLTNQPKKELTLLAQQIKKSRQVYTIGSGTTGLAAAQIAYFLRHFSKVNAISLVGADAYECYDLFGRGDLIIAPSQSGETADVLEVLEIAKNKGVKVASNVNMPGSMMTKLSDYKFMTQAGPEICVVSTKVFVAHIAWGYLLSKTVVGKWEEGVKNLELISLTIKNYLKNKRSLSRIENLAKKLKAQDHIFLLGKAQNFQIIREGMVKLIETSYKHAHAMPAGDLKHYAITLMDKNVPVIVAVSRDSVAYDVLNAVSQVKARGAYVIGISHDNHKDFNFFVEVPDCGELSSIMNLIPLQLLAYQLAVKMGNNVDRPRNIAKSVTVK